MKSQDPQHSSQAVLPTSRTRTASERKARLFFEPSAPADGPDRRGRRLPAECTPERTKPAGSRRRARDSRGVRSPAQLSGCTGGSREDRRSERRFSTATPGTRPARRAGAPGRVCGPGGPRMGFVSPHPGQRERPSDRTRAPFPPGPARPPGTARGGPRRVRLVWVSLSVRMLLRSWALTRGAVRAARPNGRRRFPGAGTEGRGRREP